MKEPPATTDVEAGPDEDGDDGIGVGSDRSGPAAAEQGRRRSGADAEHPVVEVTAELERVDLERVELDAAADHATRAEPATDALFPVPDRLDGDDAPGPTREVAVEDLLVDLDAVSLAGGDTPAAVGTVPVPSPQPVTRIPVVAAAATAAAPDVPRRMALVDAPSRRQVRAARRLQARKVARLVRHIDLYSLLKVSLLFFSCMLLVGLVAGVLIWSALQRSGAVSSIEGFAKEIFLLDEFHIEGRALFRIGVLGGMVGVAVLTLVTVLGGLLFNLISDLTGGIRVSVVELETARPAPARRRRR